MILYSPRSSPKSVASSSSESETESETESEAEDDDEDDEDEAPKPVAASASAAASGGGSDSDGEAPAARRSMPPSQSGDQLASNGLPDPSALASPETEPRKRRGFNLTISTSKEDTASPAGGKKKKKRSRVASRHDDGKREQLTERAKRRQPIDKKNMEGRDEKRKK